MTRQTTLGCKDFFKKETLRIAAYMSLIPSRQQIRLGPQIHPIPHFLDADAFFGEDFIFVYLLSLSSRQMFSHHHQIRFHL